MENEELIKVYRQMMAIPPGSYLHGNRYDTDDMLKLHLWDDEGHSWHIKVPKVFVAIVR